MLEKKLKGFIFVEILPSKRLVETACLSVCNHFWTRRKKALKPVYIDKLKALNLLLD